AEGRYFHGLEHTQEVVKNCTRLALLESCTPEELELLQVAAWFHDSGYIKGRKDHENESFRIANHFLRAFNLDERFLSGLSGLILSTKVPTTPDGLLQKIICDADLSHLGSIQYPYWQLKLRRELEFAEGIWMPDEAWNLKNILFFQSHRYYTVHAGALWDEQKQKNLTVLQGLSNKTR
ncbi:MAG TPA: HD domain-containing protein, partial [Chryseolinea sp.]|nr:HD domain-containing protein [Chryseolinea sp.]